MPPKTQNGVLIMPTLSVARTWYAMYPAYTTRYSVAKSRGTRSRHARRVITKSRMQPKTTMHVPAREPATFAGADPRA